MSERKWVLTDEYLANYTNIVDAGTKIVISPENTIDNPIYIPVAVRHIRKLYTLSFSITFTPSIVGGSRSYTLSPTVPLCYVRFKFYSKDGNITFAAERYDENGEYIGDTETTTTFSIENEIELSKLYHTNATERLDRYVYTDVYDEYPEHNDEENFLMWVEAKGQLKSNDSDLEEEQKDYSNYQENKQIPLSYYVRRRVLSTTASPYLKYEYSLNGGLTSTQNTVYFTAKSFRFFTISILRENKYTYAVCNYYDTNGELVYTEKKSIAGSKVSETVHLRILSFYTSEVKTYTYSHKFSNTTPVSVNVPTKRSVIKKVATLNKSKRQIIKDEFLKASTKRQIKDLKSYSISTKRQVNKTCKEVLNSKRLITQCVLYYYKTKREIEKSKQSINTKAITKRSVIKNASSTAQTKRRIALITTTQRNTKREIRKDIIFASKSKRSIVSKYTSSIRATRDINTNALAFAPTERQIKMTNIPATVEASTKRIIVKIFSVKASAPAVKVNKEYNKVGDIELLKSVIVKNDKGQSNIKYETISKLDGRCYVIKNNIESTPIGLSDKTKFLLVTKNKKITSENFVRYNGVIYAIDILAKYTAHSEVYLKEL